MDQKSCLRLKKDRTLWLKSYPHVLDSQPGSVFVGTKCAACCFSTYIAWSSLVQSMDLDLAIILDVANGVLLMLMAALLRRGFTWCVWIYSIYMYRGMYYQFSWFHKLPSFPRSKLLPSMSYFWDVLVQQCQWRMKINSFSLHHAWLSIKTIASSHHHDACNLAVLTHHQTSRFWRFHDVSQKLPSCTAEMEEHTST